MRRPTIADIARECGVSTTAVSFALNGKPGISDATRAAIRDKAQELGWTPSAAARALSTSRVDAIGLVITAPFSALSRDAFYLQLIAGIERALEDSPVVLLLKMVESLDQEIAAIRSWVAENRVDAAILVNPRIDDPRPALVRDLGLRAVFLGDPPQGEAEPEVSSVFVDDAQTMRMLLRDAAALGYSSAAYLHAASSYRHSSERLAALREEGDHGVEILRVHAVEETTIELTARRVAAVVDRMMVEGPPELLLCEDESITLAALTRLDQHGMAVPEDIGLVSWEGAAGLEMRPPAISSLDRDPMVLGAAAVEILTRLREDPRPRRRVIEPPRLVLRDSLRRRARSGRPAPTTS